MRTLMTTTFIALIAGAEASSGALIWAGVTAGAPTWIRPDSFTTLSGVGNVTPYEATPFFVKADGEYVFETDYRLGPDGTWWDGYILVYENAFNAASPLTNLIAGDDDFLGDYTILPASTVDPTQGSRIALGEVSNFGGAGTGLNLSLGVQYFAVVTGYDDDEFGAYRAGIAGPGDVNMGYVPAPGAAAILVLAALGGFRRKR